MEGAGLLVSLLTLVIGLVLLFAQLRLFSIDSTLKQILAELQKSSPAAPSTSQPETQEQLEQRRAAIAKVQQNWPGYK
jgi:hypothetical protein